MILVIDNYDSFTYNLVQYLSEFDDVIVFRNDKVSLKEIINTNPSHIVISPGPGTPKDSGISNEVIRTLYREIPILGICLGHQCIGFVFGGTIERAKTPMHGKTSLIYHSNRGILYNIPSPFLATRYHSLVIKKEGFPKELEIIAESEDGEIMGIMHRDFPLFGLQFHPESALTLEGKRILENFLKLKPVKEGELSNV